MVKNNKPTGGVLLHIIERARVPPSMQITNFDKAVGFLFVRLRAVLIFFFKTKINHYFSLSSFPAPLQISTS